MSTVRTVVKNTSVLFAAEIITRAISIVYFAVLARYIQSSGMGKISTGQSLVYTLLVLVSFGFDQLLTRDVAADKNKAGAYITNIGFIRGVLLFVYYLALWIAVQLFHYQTDVIIITFLYSINATLRTITDIYYDVFRAFEKMEFVLIVRVARDSINVCLSLLAIYLKYNIYVIVGASALASLIELFLGLFFIVKFFTIPPVRIDIQLVKRLFIATLPFAVVALYPLSQSYLNILILSTTTSMDNVGLFSSADSLILMVMMFPTLFMQAMFPVFSRYSSKSQSSLQIAYQKSFLFLLVFGLAISVGIYLTAAPIVELALGSGFTQAVPVLKILAWVPVVGFIGYCNGNFLCAVGKEKLFMVTEGFFALLHVGLAFLLANRYSYIGAAYAILLPTIITFVFYTVLCHRLLHLPLPWRSFLTATVAAVVMAVAVYFLVVWGVPFLLIAFLLAPIVYFGVLFALKTFSSDDIELFKQAFKLKRGAYERQ